MRRGAASNAFVDVLMTSTPILRPSAANAAALAPLFHPHTLNTLRMLHNSFGLFLRDPHTSPIRRLVIAASSSPPRVIACAVCPANREHLVERELQFDCWALTNKNHKGFAVRPPDIKLLFAA